MTESINFSGLGSGLDTKAIIDALMSVEKKPLTKLENTKSNYEQQKTIYADLKNKIQDLESAVSSMNAASEFKAMKATSSDTDIFTVSASGSANVGLHSIKVTQLAQTEIQMTAAYGSKVTQIKQGSLVIGVEGEDNVTVNITSANNALQGLVDAINASGAKVKASFVNVGTTSSPSWRVSVAATDTGKTVTLDTSGLTTGTGEVPSFTETQTQKKAIIDFDGLTNIEKTSNSITDLLDGVTITLKKPDPTNTDTVSIEPDVETMKKNINNFIDKYNAVIQYINDKTTGDTLKNDTAFRSIKSELTSMVISHVEGLTGDYKALSQVGIKTDSSGKLSLNSSTFDNMAEDHFEDITKIFTSFGQPDNPYVEFITNSAKTKAGNYSIELTGVGANFAGTINGHPANVYGGSYLIGATGTPEEGLMVKVTGETVGSYGNLNFSVGAMDTFDRKLTSWLDPVSGLLKNQTTNIDSSISRLNNEIDQKQTQLDKIEAKYKQQFAQLEASLSSMQTQNAFISSALKS